MFSESISKLFWAGVNCQWDKFWSPSVHVRSQICTQSDQKKEKQFSVFLQRLAVSVEASLYSSDVLKQGPNDWAEVHREGMKDGWWKLTRGGWGWGDTGWLGQLKPVGSSLLSGSATRLGPASPRDTTLNAGSYRLWWNAGGEKVQSAPVKKKVWFRHVTGGKMTTQTHKQGQTAQTEGRSKTGSVSQSGIMATLSQQPTALD